MDETRQLAAFVLGNEFTRVPAEVRHEAQRALVNFVGCALGGSREPAVEIAVRTLQPISGQAVAGLFGRRERLDPLRAAMVNGIAAHVHDFDDTTPANYVHPSAPVLAALFAYADTNLVSGPEFMHAFILGFETTSRVANAVYPAHYEAGWHITGTAGVFGAAAAVGRLLRLAEQNMIWAIGLAATQAAGLREMFGSMGKALHPGRAAESGYLAALLAANGFSSGRFGLEAPRGFAAVQASSSNLSRITQGLGQDYELTRNTYKPYPCGIVIHPTIEACSRLREQHSIAPAEVRSVNLRVAPLVLDLCNKKRISSGLEGKFSVYHAAAIGLVRGHAGLGEFTDAAVNDPTMVNIRELTTAVSDPHIAEDAVQVVVTLADGRHVRGSVEHAIGNLARPMSDRELRTSSATKPGWCFPTTGSSRCSRPAGGSRPARTAACS